MNMSSGRYYNPAVAEWAKQNIRGRVEVRQLFSSRLGRIFTYALVFCVPGAFFALGLVAVILGAKDPPTRYGPFVFAFLTFIPCGVIVMLGAYVRRGLAKSLDAEGVNSARGMKFPWGKLYYVDHVTKYFRAGWVTHRIKDNQLELIFEGGKVIIPPLIHGRAAIWNLINNMPAEVRDDGVRRASSAVTSAGRNQIRTQEDLMAFLKARDGAPKPSGN